MSRPGTCSEGHANPAEAVYCQQCGAAIPVPEGDAAPESSSAPVTGDADAPGPARTSSSGGRRLGLLLAGIAAIAVVVVGGVVAAVLLLGRTEVPSVMGMSQAQAQKALEDVGLTSTMEEAQFSDSVEKGKVGDQSPGPGESISSGAEVVLTLSRGPASTTPDLVGDSLTQARQAVKEADLDLEDTEQISETVAAGEVMAQDPAAGTELEAGATVSVTVSSGPPTTTVEYAVDMGSFALREEMLCSLLEIFWPSSYSSSVIVNGQGTTLATNTGWEGDPGNGNYFPCVMRTTFRNVPTTEDSYQVWWSKTDPEGDQGDTYSRQQMELSGWSIDE